MKVEIKIQDAMRFCANHQSPSTKYDLILIDLYQGDEYPKKFESENYIRLVRNILARDGVAAFNRLYFGDKRPPALKFGRKLEGVFPKVEYFYPEANVMFICSR